MTTLDWVSQEHLVYILVSLLLTMATATTYMAPLQIEATATYFSLSSSAAGTLITGELICSAITALGLSHLLSKLDVARLSLGAAVVALLTELASCLTLDLTAFIAVRLVAGLACGVLYAVACYWASQQQHGVKILSVGFMVASGTYGVALAGLPTAKEIYGLAGLFFPLAVLCLPVILQIIRVGNVPPSPPSLSSEIRNEGSRWYYLWLLLAVCAFGNGGMQMLWTFSEGAAVERGFGLTEISVVLSVSTLFNIAGSMLAGVLNRRFGMSRPLAIGMLGGVGAGMLLALTTSITGFAAGLFLYGAACFFVLPYALGAGVALDNTGRAATLAGATVFTAGAISPMIGGLIREYISLTAVAWVVAAFCVIASVSALALRKPLDS